MPSTIKSAPPRAFEYRRRNNVRWRAIQSPGDLQAKMAFMPMEIKARVSRKQTDEFIPSIERFVL